jgi:hypothetical protein
LNGGSLPDHLSGPLATDLDEVLSQRIGLLTLLVADYDEVIE